MRRRLFLAAILSATGLSGCMTHQYATLLPPGEYLNHPPQYFPAGDQNGPFPLAKETARAQAPDRIEPIPADESKPVAKPTPVPSTMPTAPQVLTPPMPQPQMAPKRSLRQRIAGLFGSSQPNAVPTPTPTPVPFVNNINGQPEASSPPQLVLDGLGRPIALFLASPSPLAGVMPGSFNALPGMTPLVGPLPVIPNATIPAALPPSITKIVPPGPVAAPTPDQLKAISPDLVKAFQKDAFDPNVTPAGGRTVAPPMPTMPPMPPMPSELPPPHRVEPTKTNVLDGTTWVRETDGGRVVLRFAGKRVTAEFTTCTPGDDGKPVTTTGTMAADFTLTDDGRLFGIITDDLDVVVKPKSAGGTLNMGRAEDRLDAPFAARVRIGADALTIQTLRTTALDATFFDDNPDDRTMCLGKYAKCADLSKLPALKPTTARPNGMTWERIHGAEDGRPLRRGSQRPRLDQPLPVYEIPSDQRAPALPFQPIDPNRIVPGEAPQQREAIPMPRFRGRTSVPVERPTIVAALEFLHTILQENPAAVTAFSTEAGRGIGQWIGRKFDRPDLGGIIGGIIGSTLGAKLIEGPKPTKPSDLDRITYWLGVK